MADWIKARKEETVYERLDWCVAALFDNNLISQSRAAELLGVQLSFFRDTVLPGWDGFGWLPSKKFAPDGMFP